MTTNQHVTKMTVKRAQCLLIDLCNKKNNYLSSANGKCSGRETADGEHLFCMENIATHEMAESPFSSLTQQLQDFG